MDCVTALLPRVVVTGHRFATLAPEREVLSGVAELHEAKPMTQEELVAATRDADAVLNQTCQFDATVIAALRRCRVIQTYGVGVDSVDVTAATTRGIFVCHVPDYCVEEVATHTFALLLAFERRVPQLMQSLREGVWLGPTAFPMRRLAGRTLGLLGFGRIARRVAQMAVGFGLTVLAHDPEISSDDTRAAGAEWLPLADLLTRSDYLSVHVPLLPVTRGLLRADTLAMLRPSAVVINTSRGAVIDQAALIDALQAGRLRGAALDVFEEEPTESMSPLVRLPSVVLTPHLAWYSEEAQDEVKRRAAEEVRRVLTGKAPRHPVNRPSEGAVSSRPDDPRGGSPC
jgi:D-3-phosphoglycerate dehydrogenase / 2-oxoglutarate reductase